MPTSEPDRNRSEPEPDRPPRRRAAAPEFLALRLALSLPLQERRRLALRLLEGEDEGTISFRRDGVHWTAFTWDVIVSSALFVDGHFHGAELSAVVAWVRRHRPLGGDGVAVNVGAHIGTAAIPLARHGGWRVLAVEPAPDSFALLEQNVRHNGLEDRITCERVAIALEDRDRVDLSLPRSNSGGAEVVPPGRRPGFLSAFPVRRVVEVPAARLAAVLAAHRICPDTVALVWSDTQGREADVIESAPALWAAGVPLYTEFDPQVLTAHGTMDAFIRAATAHFAGFAVAGDLVARGADADLRPMAEFAAACGSFSVATNALLIPRPGGPR